MPRPSKPVARAPTKPAKPQAAGAASGGGASKPPGRAPVEAAPAAQDEAADGPSVASLVKDIEAQCQKALQGGLNQKGQLPLEPSMKLAHRVWEVKAASWSAPAGSAAEMLRPLSGTSAILSEVFAAAEKLDITDHEGKVTWNASTLNRLQNLQAALTLAAMVLDAAAIHGCVPAVVDGEIGPVALQFFSRHSRTTLPTVASSLCGSTSSASVAGTCEDLLPELITTFARVLRSLHHNIALAMYSAVPVAHRAVAVAAQCFSTCIRTTDSSRAFGKMEALVAVQTASLDLLVALLGQAEEPISSAALEELIKMVESPGVLAARVTKAPRQSKHRGASNPYVAALLHAVAAICLPTAARLRDDGARGAALRYQAAEQQAGALAAGLLRQTLLEGEKEAEVRPQLERFTQELLFACTDAAWAAAPLLVWRLVGALSCIAGVGRHVDVAWTQREAAAKVLGIIAESLCRMNVESAAQKSSLQTCDVCKLVAKRGSSCDACLLRQYLRAVSKSPAKGRPSAWQADRLPGSEAKNSWMLLLAFLDASPESPGALVQPEAGAVLGAASALGPVAVQGAALPAKHPAINASLLLSICGAEPRGPALGAMKSSRGKRGDKKQPPAAAATAGAAGDAELREWASKSWQELASLSKPEARSPAAAAARYRSLLPVAARFYQSLMCRDPLNTLARARVEALESLLSLAKRSQLAHVRRQAVHGLSTACMADCSLVASRCFAESIAVGLQDDSALTRFAAIDLIHQLDGVGEKEEAVEKSLAELRGAARARLGDTSPMVRRAAFRIACAALRPGAGLKADVAELLRRARHETETVKAPTLNSLQDVVLLRQTPSAALVDLAALVTMPGVGPAGLRSLLGAHQHALDTEAFHVSMRKLVFGIVQQLLKKDEDHLPARALLLEEFSTQHPEALHEHVASLLNWLAAGADGAEADVLLARHACRVLAHTLPSWGVRVEAAVRQQAAQRMKKSLLALSELKDAGLTRAVVECWCTLVEQWSDDGQHLFERFNKGFRRLKQVTSSHTTLDVVTQHELCCTAWAVSSTVEFLDVDRLLAERIGPEESCGGGLARAALWMVSSLFLQAPRSMQPLLIPCVGFILRKHPALVQGLEGPFEAFQRGLADSLAPVRLHTAESLAALLTKYQQAAQVPTVPGGESAAAVKHDTARSDVSKAVQCLARLQLQCIGLLHETAPRQQEGATELASGAACQGQALAVLDSFAALGVLHPPTILPGLLSTCFAGPQQSATSAGRLALQLIGNNPVLAVHRLGVSVREAALLCSGVTPGSCFREAWRFATLREAYLEHLDSRPLREQFLDAAVAEITGSSTSGARGDADCRTYRQELLRLELLIGVLARLPLRNEFELGRIVHRVNQFLVLRTALLLMETDGAPAADEQEVGRPSSLFSCCVASVLLHALCQHWASGHEGLLARALAGEMDQDQALPPGFSRRPLPDLGAPMRELAAVDPPSDAQLLKFLARYIPADTKFLKGPEDRALGAAKRRCRAASPPAENSRGGKKPRRADAKKKASS